MRTHDQAGGCSRSEDFEDRHSTHSLPALWLQPATLSSWASFLSSVKKSGMWSKQEDCAEHIVESSWFTVGPHKTLVFISSLSPFTNEELLGSEGKGGSPEVTQLVDPLFGPKPTSLYPRCPVPWIFTQPHILWAKTNLRCFWENRIHPVSYLWPEFLGFQILFLFPPGSSAPRSSLVCCSVQMYY